MPRDIVFDDGGLRVSERRYGQTLPLSRGLDVETSPAHYAKLLTMLGDAFATCPAWLIRGEIQAQVRTTHDRATGYWHVVTDVIGGDWLLSELEAKELRDAITEWLEASGAAYMV